MSDYPHQHKGAKFIIGGLEDIGLPDWGIPRIRARVDTGARVSAIHVEEVERLAPDRLRFYVVTGWRKKRRRKRVIAHIKKSATVRPTTGRGTSRWVVETEMVLGPVRRKIEITLADRKHMTFRMLLGRTALRDDFLVDPSRLCILSRQMEKD